MPKMSYSSLVSFGGDLLVRLGFAAEDARYIAETAAFAEAGGLHTHGAVVLSYIEAQCGSGIDPKAMPRVVQERAASALLDGNRAAGGVCMRLAIEMARRKAREAGVAVVAVRNTSWIAALGPYLAPLAREGFMAHLLAQSCQCQDAAPHGSLDPCFSTNPMALAFPTDDGPVIADFSTAAMSMGRVRTLAKAGRKAAQPAFFTKDGQLTDDPNAVLQGGSMLPAGGDFDGHKGYALALWIEALTAMAGGRCNDPGSEQRQSFTLWLLDPDAFGQREWYVSEMRRMSARIRGGRPRPGVEAIRLPGERLFAEVERSKTSGVELTAGVLKTLTDAARRRGVPLPEPFQ